MATTIWNRTDNGPPADANAIAHNDIWDGGNAQDDRASELVFDSQAGSDYLVQIGSCSGCGGSLPATGGIEPIAFDAPPNDAHGSARALTAGRGVLVDNFGATTEPGERVECGADHPYEGKVSRYRTRRGKRPSVSQLCLQPGATRPGSCL